MNNSRTERDRKLRLSLFCRGQVTLSIRIWEHENFGFSDAVPHKPSKVFPVHPDFGYLTLDQPKKWLRESVIDYTDLSGDVCFQFQNDLKIFKMN